MAPEELGWVGTDYRLLALLGRGGMGEVFQAHQVTLDRQVALKRLSALDEESGRRFEREARIHAAMKHEGLVELYDFGIWQKAPYLVMELLVGESLRDQLGSGPLEDATVASVAEAMCRALSHVHQNGVVHRDVKPENIFMCRDGRVKLGDFGIARLETGGMTITRAGMVMGSLAYMAPERFSEAAPDPLEDQYSLGMTIFEMLARGFPHDVFPPGRVPAVRPLGTVRADLPPVLVGAVERAISPDPSRRFASVEVFREALEKGFAARARSSSRGASMRTHAVSGRTLAGGDTRSTVIAQSWLRRFLLPLLALGGIGLLILRGLAGEGPGVSRPSPQASTMGTHIGLARQRIRAAQDRDRKLAALNLPDTDRFPSPSFRTTLLDAFEALGRAYQVGLEQPVPPTPFEWLEILRHFESASWNFSHSLVKYLKASQQKSIEVPAARVTETRVALEKIDVFLALVERTDPAMGPRATSPIVEAVRRFVRVEADRSLDDIHYMLRKALNSRPPPLRRTDRVAKFLEAVSYLRQVDPRELWQESSLRLLHGPLGSMAHEVDEDAFPDPLMVAPGPEDIQRARSVHEAHLQLLEDLATGALPPGGKPEDSKRRWLFLHDVLILLHPRLGAGELGPRVLEAGSWLAGNLPAPADPEWIDHQLHTSQPRLREILTLYVERGRASGRRPASVVTELISRASSPSGSATGL